jgi:glutathione-regulated potassium-efflux system ancillary protein KefC
MVAVNPLDLDLVIIFSTVVGTALLARRTQLPITALEILAGMVLAALFAFDLPEGTASILALGGLFIVFLAGFETGFGFLRANFRRAITIGLAGFLAPFVGLFAILFWVIHAPLLIAVIGGTVLADTSISITYTTLQQYDLADLPFGRLILASALCINLAEDLTITTATFLSTPGFVFTVAVLGALGLAALLLPRLARAVEGPEGAQVWNIGARTLLLSLALLALLSAFVGVPGILFVFLMGLIFSQLLPQEQWRGYLDTVRPIAFALFIPVYFVAVGLRVDLGFVLAHWPLLLALAAAASAFKIVPLFPILRKAFGPTRAGPVAVLLNTRLTSATVILTLTLGLGLLSVGWYSLLISVVVVLALVSSVGLRAFSPFRSPAAARALFITEADADAPVGEPLSGPAPAH